MPDLKQPGFKFALPISEKELMGIGMVICRWALLENLLRTFFVIANKGPATYRDGSPLHFKSMCGQFKEIISRDVTQASNQVFLCELINTITGIQHERDTVTHHVWSDTTGSLTLFDFGGKRGITERRMDWQKLQQVALKIDAAQAQLMSFLMENGKPDQPLFETAWLRICEKP